MTRAELLAAAEALEWAAQDLPIQGGILFKRIRDRIKELRAQADAMPEDEPVAWITRDTEGLNALMYDQADIDALPVGTDFYPHPDPRVKELSDADIERAVHAWFEDDGQHVTLVGSVFMRRMRAAIAAALKGKP